VGRAGPPPVAVRRGTELVIDETEPLPSSLPRNCIDYWRTVEQDTGRVIGIGELQVGDIVGGSALNTKNMTRYT
jgi:hypothetical protein